MPALAVKTTSEAAQVRNQLAALRKKRNEQQSQVWETDHKISELESAIPAKTLRLMRKIKMAAIWIVEGDGGVNMEHLDEQEAKLIKAIAKLQR